MFRDACTLARKFTLPVVTSVRTIDGQCTSAIGTFVVINDEGWIITAAHVLKYLVELTEAEARTRALERQVPQKIDPSLPRRERRRLAAKGPSASDVDKWSTWWAGLGQLDRNSTNALDAVYLAVGKLDGFDRSQITAFPQFKDPTKDFEPGTSLCRLGFPFYDIKPVYDTSAGMFNLTNVPLPIFPNEGILSRMQEIVMFDEKTLEPLPPPPFPLHNIETSSPGIRGQSEGPIYDQQGAVWGIQTSTTSWELDMSTKEKQYYNVGVGVASETIIGFLKHLNIKFQLSAH